MTALAAALRKGLDHLVQFQTEQGSLHGDYDGPLFLLPGYIFAHYATRMPLPEEQRQAFLATIRGEQNPDGGFGLHREGKSYLFTTVLNHVALRLLGAARSDPAIERTRRWIQRARRRPGNSVLGQILAGHPAALRMGRHQPRPARNVAVAALVSAAPRQIVVPCPHGISAHLLPLWQTLSGPRRAVARRAARGTLRIAVCATSLSPGPQPHRRQRSVFASRLLAAPAQRPAVACRSLHPQAVARTGPGLSPRSDPARAVGDQLHRHRPRQQGVRRGGDVRGRSQWRTQPQGHRAAAGLPVSVRTRPDDAVVQFVGTVGHRVRRASHGRGGATRQVSVVRRTSASLH